MGRYVLPSCQVSSNSVWRYQRRSRKIRRRCGHLGIPISLTKHELVCGRCVLASCQVSSNAVRQMQKRIRKYLGKSETRDAIVIFRPAFKTRTWLRTLSSLFLSCFVQCRLAVSGDKSKMSLSIIVQGHLRFSIAPKNINLVEYVVFLIRHIPFCGIGWELEYISKQKRSTEGCSKFKGQETRQVQERLVSTLEHMQVQKWDRTRCPEE